jgi:hypothetical protein
MKTVPTINRIGIIMVLFSIISTTQPLLALDQQVVKTKDFYIGRINLNSKETLNFERIVSAGLTVNALSLAGGLITASGILVGTFMISVGLVAYGPQLLTTYVSVNRLEQLLKQYPELASFMTKNDTRSLNAGKAVLKGQIGNYIAEQVALKNTIKKTAAQFEIAHQKLLASIPQKKRSDALLSYFSWTTNIKFYEEARQQQAMLRAKAKGITKTTLNVINALIMEPIVMARIALAKKNIDTLVHKKYPVLEKLIMELQAETNTLFAQLKNIKQQHERSSKNFAKK